MKIIDGRITILRILKMFPLYYVGQSLGENVASEVGFATGFGIQDSSEHTAIRSKFKAIEPPIQKPEQGKDTIRTHSYAICKEKIQYL